MLTIKKELKILDFDIENRPLTYWYDGKPTAEVTAIASCWDKDITTMQVDLLGLECRHHGWDCPDMFPEEMDGPTLLARFVERYDEADIVTGHFIRVHDLPIINGALIEAGLPKLSPKLTIDTKNDLVKKGDIPATQEFLGEMLGLPAEKVHMSQVKWREGNRLTPKGLEATKKRAMGDVYQHILLRSGLTGRELLRASKMWYP